jgi:flagellar hook-associated protein 2
VQTFITSYNAVVDQINGQLSQAPSKTDPTVGQLYGDTGLSSLLSNMRQAMYSSAPSLPAGMSSLLNIGISTGAATGSATPSQGAISGHLTLNTSALEQAIQSNPSGVVNVLKSFSANFANLVNAVAQPGGTLDSRIQGDNSQVADLGNQIAAMQSALADKQKQLQQQFAALEGALSQNQSTSSWLTTQLNNLVVP